LQKIQKPNAQKWQEENAATNGVFLPRWAMRNSIGYAISAAPENWRCSIESEQNKAEANAKSVVHFAVTTEAY